MPILGVIVGSVDFKDLAITLQDKTDTHEAVVLNYGAFIQTIFDFLLIALSIFIAMKVFINIQKRFTAEEDEAKAKAEAEAAAAAAAKPDPQIELLTEIRDLMKNNAAK